MLDFNVSWMGQSIITGAISQPVVGQIHARPTSSSYFVQQATLIDGQDNAVNKDKYKLASNGLSLIVANLTKFDWLDEYKCRAINTLGSTTSSNSVKLGADCK